MRCFVQTKQCCSLFDQGGLSAEVFAGEVGKTKLVFGGEFPCEVKLDGGAQSLRIAHQVGGRGLLKLEQQIGSLDLDPFAGFQLDLGRAFRFGEDAARLEFSSFFKQCVHARHCPTLHSGRRLQVQKIQQLGQVVVEVADGVVAAFHHHLMRVRVTSRHFAPIQHFVALGNERPDTLWV